MGADTSCGDARRELERTKDTAQLGDMIDELLMRQESWLELLAINEAKLKEVRGAAGVLKHTVLRVTFGAQAIEEGDTFAADFLKTLIAETNTFINTAWEHISAISALIHRKGVLCNRERLVVRALTTHAF